jgi:predicted RNA binding protein YcfA (HicA-like mRNA interferase family)
MKPLSAKRVMTILKKNGFVVSRRRGSHIIFRHPATNIIVPVPLHNKSKPIPIGTFLAIVKQSKLPREKFRR